MNGVVRGAIELASSSAIAARGFKDLFSPAPGCDAIRCSGHIDGLLVAPAAPGAVFASGPPRPQLRICTDAGRVLAFSWRFGLSVGQQALYPVLVRFVHHRGLAQVHLAFAALARQVMRNR